MPRIALIIAFSVLFALGCKKEETVDPSPEITYVSMSASQVVEFENQVEVTFSYKDADGDIGEPDPDVKTLRVKDARLSEADFYHIPPVTPELQALNVEGTFTVVLNPLFLLGNGSQETTSFNIQLEDRAGNLSNTIMTPEVLITDSL
ncbi:hypothetical protein [Halocola ammonii]